VKRAFQVGIQNLIPIFLGHSHTQSISCNAGIVNQNVHLAERLQNFAAKIGDRFAVGHVDGVSQCGFGFLLIQLIGGFLSVFHCAANDGNSGAFSGEPLGDCLPYSAAGAG